MAGRDANLSHVGWWLALARLALTVAVSIILMAWICMIDFQVCQSTYPCIALELCVGNGGATVLERHPSFFARWLVVLRPPRSFLFDFLARLCLNKIFTSYAQKCKKTFEGRTNRPLLSIHGTILVNNE